MNGLDVKVRFGAYCISPNDKGELDFESGAGTNTKINAEEVHNRALQAQSLEEMFEYLKESGAYIGSETSRIMIVEAPGGVQVFSKDEPGRKIVINKEVPEQALAEISQIVDYDHEGAVRKILESHGFKKEEIEEIFTSKGMSFEKEAENIDSRDITDGGEIGAARLARDNMEDPNRGVYSEQDMERRKIEEERLKQRKADRAEDRDNGGMER